MSPIKEFATALREAENSPILDEGMTFKVDNTELRCFKPTDSQMAILMASVSRTQDTASQIAGIINFFVEVLDDFSHSYITGRLLDRLDPFGLDEVREIMEWMVEEWSGHPIEPPSVSTRSQHNGGRKSSRTTTKSKSSVLVPADS